MRPRFLRIGLECTRSADALPMRSHTCAANGVDRRAVLSGTAEASDHAVTRLARIRSLVWGGVAGRFERLVFLGKCRRVTSVAAGDLSDDRLSPCECRRDRIPPHTCCPFPGVGVRIFADATEIEARERLAWRPSRKSASGSSSAAATPSVDAHSDHDPCSVPVRAKVPNPYDAPCATSSSPRCVRGALPMAGTREPWSLCP
jgi:hypothetical protein